MFKVLSGQKRRVISPATIAASIAAHVLLLGGAVYAAASDRPSERLSGVIEVLPPLPEEPRQPEPEEPAPPAPAPEQPDQPQVPEVPGEVLQLEQVTKVPDSITPEPPGLPEVKREDYERDGQAGNVIGEPTGDPQPVPPAPPTPQPAEEWIIDDASVEQRPELDRNGLARAMERYYPAILRDSRTTGRVVIELVVDTDGRVREGSARIVEASHPAFGEAALRAAERFRFRPGKMAGIPVPVRVTLPIQWTVPR